MVQLAPEGAAAAAIAAAMWHFTTYCCIIDMICPKLFFIILETDAKNITAQKQTNDKNPKFLHNQADILAILPTTHEVDIFT